MHKCISTTHAMAFCEKHKISMDWLLCGDLQGLHRMTKEAKAESAELTEAQRKEVTQLFLALSPRMQSVALALIRELLAGGICEAPAPNGQEEAKPPAVRRSRKAARAITRTGRGLRSLRHRAAYGARYASTA
jgi:hypothetical protein